MDGTERAALGLFTSGALVFPQHEPPTQISSDHVLFLRCTICHTPARTAVCSLGYAPLFFLPDGIARPRCQRCPTDLVLDAGGNHSPHHR